MDKAKLNGGIDRLASALRDVVREAAGEAIEKGVAPLRQDIAAFKAETEKQFAEVRGEIGQLHHKTDWPQGGAKPSPARDG